jgi:hypothetical protein
LRGNKSQTTTFKATYTYGTDARNTVQQSCIIPPGATSHTITITHNFGFATGAPNAQSMDGSQALAVARQNRGSGSGSGGNPDEAVIVTEEILGRRIRRSG